MIEQGTAAWLEERAGLITCSRLGAILGLDKYCTAKKHWQIMCGLREPDPTNVAMSHGTKHEPDAIFSWEMETGKVALPSGFIKHRTIAFLGGSPDGMVDDDMVLETKAPYSRRIPETPPPHYYAQVQGLLEVTGRHVGILYYWTPEGATRAFQIDRDREWWGEAYPTLERFYNAVQRKEWIK